MKKQIHQLLVACLAVVLLLTVLLPRTALAAEVVKQGYCGSNVTWTLDSEGTLTISGSGAMKRFNYVQNIPWYQENIRKIVIEPGVTSISRLAFAYCADVTEVTIPDTVTSIGEMAFEYCSGLTGVTLPDSVKTIEGWAFSHCTGLKSIVIPDSVTKIGECAFMGCESLASVTLPSGITNIESSTFLGCKALTALTIPDSVTAIAGEAFRNCGLTSMTIPAGVKSLVGSAFANCSKLTKLQVHPDNAKFMSDGKGAILSKDGVTLICVPSASGNYTVPAGVREIGSYAFSYNEGLTGVTLPDSMEKINTGAFENCGNLTTVSFHPDLKTIGSDVFKGCDSLKELIISGTAYPFHKFYSKGTAGDNLRWLRDEEGTVIIYGSGPMMDCTASKKTYWGNGIKKAIVCPGVTRIGEYIFEKQSELTSVTLPEGITSIGSMAFDSCTALKEISIPQTVTDIDRYAFRYCSSLTSLTIPEGTEHIGSFALQHCTALAELTICGKTLRLESSGMCGPEVGWWLSEDKTLLLMGDGGMNGYNASGAPWGQDVKELIVFPGVLGIGSNAFYGCSELTSVTLPDSVIAVHDYAFSGCTGLTDITLSKKLTQIGRGAFSGCTALTGLSLPEGMTEIGEKAFLGCTGLTDVVIPDGMTDLGMEAFSGCTGLKTVTIGDGVDYIFQNTFYGCTELTTVTISKSVISVDGRSFIGCEKLTNIHIDPDNANYQADGNGVVLSKDGKTLVIVTGKREEYTVPDGVTKVLQRVFPCGDSLVTLRLPASVTSVDSKAFAGCTALTDIQVDEGNTTYRSDGQGGLLSKDGKTLLVAPFAGEHYTVPAGVTCIGEMAFYMRSDLKTLTIPASVASIDRYAFALGTLDHQIQMTVEGTTITYKAHGSCGENVAWLLGEDGTVIILGSGVMKDYGETEDTPWGKEITNAVICSGITGVGDRAFSGCENLTSVHIGESVERVGSSAFHGCAALTQVTLPDNLVTIGKNAFCGCESLSTVTIPGSVTTIEAGAFAGATGLKSAYYTGTGEDWGKVEVGADNQPLLQAMWHNDNGVLYRVSDGTLTIRFSGELPEYEMGSTPWHSFRNDVTLVVLDERITAIRGYAFASFRNLKYIYLGSQVTEIGLAAFTGCTELTVHGEADSYAEEYAQKHNISFSSRHGLVYQGHVDATCEIGEHDAYVCNQCAMVDRRNEAEALGHDVVTLEGREASCTAPGLTEGQKCTRCHEILVAQEKIPIEPHQIVGTESKAPTCTEPGYTADGYCSVCSQVFLGEELPVDPDAHNHAAAVTPPTCTEEGYTTYTCICGNTYTADTTPAKGHTEVTVPAQEPTCVRPGRSEGKRCADCGHIFVPQTITPAAGHRWDEGVVTKEPGLTEPGIRTYTCTVCGETKEETISSSHDHNYQTVVTPPTCTEDGYTTYTCSCGETHKADTVPAKGHSYTTSVTAPTCDADGYTTHTCVCGDTYTTAVVPAKGHKYTLWYIDTEPSGGLGMGTAHRDCANGHTERNSYNFTLTDVPAGKYYSKPVYWAFVNGITKGKTATEFQRDASCTRKQIVMFLWRAAGQPEPASMENPFVDVKADQFQKAILWAYHKGITSGKTATEFKPEDPCTREQIVMFLWRFFDKPTPASMANPFTDVKIGGTFEKAILWAYYEGITTGKTATEFQPTGTCTRGQIVTFLYRAMVPGSTTPPAIPVAPEKPADGELVLEYTGTGERIIRDIDLPKGEYYAECIHSGSHSFIAYFYIGDLYVSNVHLATGIGSFSQRTYLEGVNEEAVSGGRIEVKAEGNWTIRIRKISTTTTTKLSGTGSAVTGTFVPTSGTITVNLKLTGGMYRTVDLIKYGGTDDDTVRLTSKISGSSGTVKVNVEPGAKYFFYVDTLGSWSIDLGLGDKETVYTLPAVPGGSSTVKPVYASWAVEEVCMLNRLANMVYDSCLDSNDFMEKSKSASIPLLKIANVQLGVRVLKSAEIANSAIINLLEANESLPLTQSNYATILDMAKDLQAKLVKAQSHTITQNNLSSMQYTLSNEISEIKALAQRLLRLTYDLMEQHAV